MGGRGRHQRRHIRGSSTTPDPSVTISAGVNFWREEVPQNSHVKYVHPFQIAHALSASSCDCTENKQLRHHTCNRRFERYRSTVHVEIGTDHPPPMCRASVFVIHVGCAADGIQAASVWFFRQGPFLRYSSKSPRAVPYQRLFPQP